MCKVPNEVSRDLIPAIFGSMVTSIPSPALPASREAGLRG